ncbi:MAG: phosphomethylpyrimidine synthase ThiC [Mogibacterium diversum]|uniref:phosphomethylpyrimidine synthase ThiC n=1 Tax=Mogibacterium diversum TaxID=114527 RepID=UPI001CAE7ECC|nr:phosphomethylpyrimidine synthase ThiC [Mogibacterium diversum]MBF1341267.1 phosphomethylpyrimidine synthase ThiC [Mogibacterium diversum]MBF1358067.1 phosphomethylpyrimidine synthase ThiC [Mogibacterium diversum]MBF1359598.1 phosphomethylpyrimidine synthase ThiC [Mogibacterium diversum]
MTRTYSTQIEAARMGIVTPELEIVAAKENRSVDELLPLLAEGKMVIPANIHHTSIDPNGVGGMLRTKVNVNLGISRDCKDYNIEMKKVMRAVELGAESIMDLSSHGDTQPFRRKLCTECPAMIGTVPVYDSVIHYQRDLNTLTAQDFLDVIRMHAEDGVDFVTLHCGITRKTIEQIKNGTREMNIVSRGGSLVFAWMTMTGEENPFYEYFDEIVEICREHDVTISLGDACRPGCLADATDNCQIEELIRLGELTDRAWARDVQVMIEGPGHVPMDQIEANMKVQETLCKGAPFYVLGPLVTDIAPGYDHITAAIGGAIAAWSGAAFLCYVTPAEHLALPNVDDVHDGIIASKIAAHAADIAKGIPGARDQDDRMAKARRKLDWDAQWLEALDPETAKAIRESRMPEEDHSDTCSMCGKFCAVRSMNKALSGEVIDIL